ncbi:GNAT family N-acetyltransferase [Maribacter sp. 4U21]|uniref:GNAT family N-acetyltransferase n=1 Tax=Maribacter sp. 4U21 TaxID=1889779 RepID=UPI000C14CE77|nr:GNAT family protein [Maribacter sp. 4U21]PIB25503.1 GNAT family N-acetyltransferase [Maribacter sp. 4U21]
MGVILEDRRVKLTPLTLENYAHLIPIASEEKLIQYSPSDIGSPESLKRYVQLALAQQSEGKSIPFIVYDKKNNSYAGSTRYMHINRKNKVLHIGATWIGKEFQGSGLNSHMKQLMLSHAFEKMEFEKVEFRVDERNIVSRKAMEKLGCTLEGVLRRDVYLLDGYKRNTCCYGLLKQEWDRLKK